MFPYRGVAVLIALCAFGAIQASFVRRDDFRRFIFGHHGNFNSSNSSSNSNVTLPSGNYSHPGQFNSSGNWNSSRPIRSHRFHHLNSSNVGNANSSYVPSWNATGYGFRPRPSNSSNPGNYSSSFPQGQRPSNFSTVFNNAPQGRGFFNRRPAYGNNNSSRVPANRPVYRPDNRPVYRPPVNSTWSRPGNSSWVHWG